MDVFQLKQEFTNIISNRFTFVFLSLPLSGQKEFWFWFQGNKGKKLKANTKGVSRNYKLNLVWVLRENLP